MKNITIFLVSEARDLSSHAQKTLEQHSLEQITEETHTMRQAETITDHTALTPVSIAPRCSLQFTDSPAEMAFRLREFAYWLEHQNKDMYTKLVYEFE